MAIKNFEAIEGDVIEAIRQRMGLEPDDSSRDDYIRKMSPDAMLEDYLNWHGMVSLAGDILRAVNDIRDAFAETRAPDEWPFVSDFIY